ncbi:MAG: glycosyltransferase [Myxococcales bacterium]|nr:glycosyltransferase [Myxococcales bacterium]
MRIAHVYNWLDPAIGGPPRVIAGLAAGQQRLGHEVRLISSDHPGAPAVDRFLAARLDPLPPRTTIRPKFFRAVRTRSALRDALRGVDIAHLHGIWPPATLLAGQMCRALGIPYILAPHGSLHAGALAEKWPRKRIGLWFLGYGALIRHAAALHLLNDDERQMPGFVPAPTRCFVLPNGIFADEFATAPPAGLFRQSMPALGDAPFVLFLARQHPGKGGALLGEAFARVAAARPDVHLVAAGPEQGGRPLLAAAAARHGFTDRLHQPGALDGVQKLAALREAALFCLPSHHEGFSVGILEAMASGAPVVISDRCHFAEVEAEGAGRVAPLAPEPFAQALLDVLADPVAAHQMGQRGRARVLAAYTWPAISARAVAEYQATIRP